MKDGGPAFPVEASPDAYSGMTLRDYFAGQVVAGNTAIGSKFNKADKWATFAADAYAVADAMLKARDGE